MTPAQVNRERFAAELELFIALLGIICVVLLLLQQFLHLGFLCVCPCTAANAWACFIGTAANAWAWFI